MATARAAKSRRTIGTHTTLFVKNALGGQRHAFDNSRWTRVAIRIDRNHHHLIGLVVL